VLLCEGPCATEDAISLFVHEGTVKKSEDQYSPEETERRLQKTLKAALSMKPTPLKEIPRKRKPRAAEPK